LFINLTPFIPLSLSRRGGGIGFEGAKPLQSSLINNQYLIRGENYKWNARLRSIKLNAPAPMSLAPEKANAVSAYGITWSLMSFLPAYSLRK
jgi:hypothetical protein